MASERIEKLLAMQQKAEAQKRKAEQQLKATEAAPPREGALIRIFDAPCVLRRPLRGARCLRHQQGQAPAPIASATP